MYRIKRRQFLQFAGSAIATLGLSHLDIIRQGNRYARALAPDTSRKLALLVGINAYPFDNELSGCVTDVEMQKNLLIYRFGFHPKDILTLTDSQATRQNILAAFEEHLIKQAKPGDVAVFHYSGHGSRVADPECIYKDREGNCLNSTFVPTDNNLSLKAREKGGEVPDITGHTLWLLMSALQTENFTAVLDSCHSGGGKRGNLTVRSIGGGSQLKANQAEIEYQQQWLSKLNLSPQEYKRQLQAGVAKGAVIASARLDQLAADAPFSGFKAGAFTYVMTQYLWQQTGNEPLESAVANIGRSTTQMSAGQNPEYEVKGANSEEQPVYFQKLQTAPAEATITGGEGGEVELWLGGINSYSIRTFDKGAILTLVDASGKKQGLVRMESRNGLIGRAKPIENTNIDALKLGSLLQERVRVVPADVTLRIGLDQSLGNDKPEAEAALRLIKQVEAFPAQQGKEVEYLLGRITSDNRQFQTKPAEDIPAPGSAGLFTPALELIPGSFGAAGEPVSAAVTRLKSKLKSLLAAHLVKMILNPASSQLNVAATMNLPDSEILASTFTVRGAAGKTEAPAPQGRNLFKQLPVGTRLQFQVTNKENRDLHVSVLVIDPEGEMTVIFPNTWTAAQDATLVKAGETLRIPEQGKDSFKLTVQKPLGIVEILVLASGTPLGESLKALQAIAARGGQARGKPMTLADEDPKIVIDSLLNDLNRGTRGGGVVAELDESVRGVDTTQLAALSITFESVEKPNA
jgi:hypothetical protein